jgi:hypothetical protein
LAEFKADGTYINTVSQEDGETVVTGTYTYSGNTLVMHGEDGEDDTITLRADRKSFDALLGGVFPIVFYKQ